MLRRSLPLILSTMLFSLCSYVVNVFLGRHLGPAEYGVLGLTTSLMSALNIMQVSGVPQAMSKYLAEDPAHSEDILWSGVRLQLLVSGVLMVVFAAASPLLARLFHESSLVGYILVTALILPGYGLYAAYAGYYNGLQRFGKQAVLAAVYSVAKLVFIVGLGLQYGLIGALVGYTVSPLAALFFGFHRPQHAGVFPARKLVTLTAPLVGFAGLALLQYSVDLYTVKAVVRSAVSSGYYVASQNVSMIPLIGLGALAQVLLPRVSSLLARGAEDDAAAAAAGALRQTVLLLLPATAMIAGSAPGVLRLLFGADYAPASGTLRVMVTSYMAVTTFALCASVLNGAGRARTSMGLAGIGLGVTLVLCLALVPHFGLLAAASTTGVGGLVATLAAVRAIRAFLPFRVPWVSLGRIALCASIVLALCWLPVRPILVPGVWIGAFALYCLLLVVTGEITREELRRLTGPIRARVRPAA